MTTSKRKLPPFLTKIHLKSADFQLNPGTFFSWRRLVHVFAYVCRFVTNCRDLTGRRQFGKLTVEEVCDAEIGLIRCTQDETFSEEIKQLEKQQVLM